MEIKCTRKRLKRAQRPEEGERKPDAEVKAGRPGWRRCSGEAATDTLKKKKVNRI